ncbi:MAG: class II aldolase/adducin family protein [Alicyclobacillus sp.]|nr:class II aldolase/adducin family protein [Alicyclobacillus sp.]
MASATPAALTAAQLRTQVAHCCLLIQRSGLGDYSGHVSVRVPGASLSEDRIYINGRLTPRGSLRPEDILCCNLDGERLEGNDLPPAEIAMHTRIYRARPDVQCIAHFHPPHAVLFSAVNRPLVPVFLKGAMVGPVPVHDDPRHIGSDEQGDALARTLGNGRAVLLRGHGVVVVGRTVEEVFFLSVCLEENAKRYRECLALGEPKPLTPEEQADIVGSGYKQERFQKIWDYYASLYGLPAAADRA